MKFFILIVALFSSSLLAEENFVPAGAIRWGVGSFNEWQLHTGDLASGLAVSTDIPVLSESYRVEGAANIFHINNGAETQIFLLIKKPFQLLHRLEMEFGLGPQVVRSSNDFYVGTYVGGQATVKFLYWFEKRWAVSLAPAYQVVFRNQAEENNLGLTALLIYGRE